MRVRPYLPLILHTFFWATLGSVLLLSGGPIFYRALRVGKIGPIDPNRSIEPYFRVLTGIPNSPQKLGDILENLPQRKPLLIFVRRGPAQTVDEVNENSQSEFLGMLIAYVSWPHAVQIIGVNHPTADQEVAAINRDAVAGMAFCSLPAPTSLSNAISLGKGISLVPSPNNQ